MSFPGGICEGCATYKRALFVSHIKGRCNHGICYSCIEDYYPETVNALTGALHPCWSAA